MAKRHGLIDGELVLPDESTHPDCDDGTIWTNLTDNELCICMKGEKKLIRIDGGTGIDNTQRVVVRVEENSEDSLMIFYVDLTITDGVVTGVSGEGSYEVRIDT